MRVALVLLDGAIAVGLVEHTLAIIFADFAMLLLGVSVIRSCPICQDGESDNRLHGQHTAGRAHHSFDNFESPPMQ